MHCNPEDPENPFKMTASVHPPTAAKACCERPCSCKSTILPCSSCRQWTCALVVMSTFFCKVFGFCLKGMISLAAAYFSSTVVLTFIFFLFPSFFLFAFWSLLKTFFRPESTNSCNYLTDLNMLIRKVYHCHRPSGSFNNMVAMISLINIAKPASKFLNYYSFG